MILSLYWREDHCNGALATMPHIIAAAYRNLFLQPWGSRKDEAIDHTWRQCLAPWLSIKLDRKPRLISSCRFGDTWAV
jgi:hypothetical protein